MSNNNDMKKVAIFGWPVRHSLSPRLHNYWIRQHAIKGQYEAIAVQAENLKFALEDIKKRGFLGLNLTLPHKQHVMELVDEIDPLAKRIGAVNTIVIKNGVMRGTNTDAHGFIANLKSHNIVLKDKDCMVIGAGGAARAVCAGLLSEGAKILLVNRTQDKAEALAILLGGAIKVMPWEQYARAMNACDILINATSLGMHGEPPLPLSLETLPSSAIVTDIVYNPLRTALLEGASARGNQVIDGLGMLLYQAQPAFEAWFDVKPEVSPELRAHMVEALQ